MLRKVSSNWPFWLKWQIFLVEKSWNCYLFSNYHVLFSPQVSALKLFLWVLTTLVMQEKLILDPQTSTNWYYYSFSKLCPGFHSSNNLFDLQKANFCLCLSSQLEQINDHRNKWNIHLKAHMYLEYSKHIGQSKIQNPKIGVFQWILPKTAIVHL